MLHNNVMLVEVLLGYWRAYNTDPSILNLSLLGLGMELIIINQSNRGS